MQLSREQLDRFDREGYLFFPSLFWPQEIAVLNAEVPRLKPARVTVTLTDGRRVTRLRESARGDHQDPYREDEIRAKFRELAGVVLGTGEVARLEALVDRCDELPRFTDLLPPLRSPRPA